MSRLDVNVTCVRASRKSSRIPAGPYVYQISTPQSRDSLRYGIIAESIRLLDSGTMLWKGRVPQRCELIRAQRVQGINRRKETEVVRIVRPISKCSLRLEHG